ncbi:SNF2 family N-terminal domain-containing protein [Bombardia bombarda]|uniref:SNF2 family N-terminal domain-containing protein n=1 Tax=Bombardia bombarda TaxID=252184 RepID=A0AA40BY87_9PEZI|nr:SNF2 family N-terminal domain-containing protein [Bombardia bombarda]
MAFSSSPIVARRSGPFVETTPNAKRRDRNDHLDIIDDDDDDDQLSIVSQSPYFTQPTQIIEQPALHPKPKPTLPSSPRSAVEVPASSPYRPPPQSSTRPAGRLANLMAPAGTAFRAPAQQTATIKSKNKREFVMISDDELDTPVYAGDSSDDNTPARGDIKPSSFQRKESSNFIVAASRVPDQPNKRSKNVGSPITSPASSSESLPDLASLPPKADLPKAPPRRRLVQGRRHRESSPASSPAKPTQAKLTQTKLSLTKVSSGKPRPVIDLVSDNDDEDDYKNTKASPDSSSPTMGDFEESAFNKRVLNYLNTCNIVQLIAITGVKEEMAKAMLSHKPFANLDAARKVTMNSRNKKTGRVAIGEEIMSAIKSYAKALDGIDHVIAVCESQAESIKAATSTWDVDITGQPKGETKNSEGKPLTPMSVNDPAKLVDLPLRQPRYMEGNCTMKSFQVYGLNWLYLLYKNQYGGILADDMGLGKTCQVISLMCSIVEDWENNGVDDGENQPWPNVVFVPPSTLANWKEEFKKFAPELNVTLYQGSQAVRDKIAEDIMDDPSQHHVVLTSYTQVSRQDDIQNLKRLQPMVAVFDEGHKLKNPKTKLYKDLIKITATWRLILSGTPVQNNLMEMIALLQFVEPDLFKNHYDDLEALFNQKVTLTAVSQGALLHSERVQRARTILEPFILQRKKEQVLKDLPPKTTRVEYCKMETTQKNIYKVYEQRFRKVDVVAKPPQDKGRENDNNNVWIQLRKSAIHPQLFRRAFTDKNVENMAKTLMDRIPQTELRQPNINHLINELKALSDFELHLWCRDYPCIRKYDIPKDSWMESAKVKVLLKMIHEYQENGDRVLVFTRFAKVIEILGECLSSEDIQYLSLQGNTDVSERQELINEFNEDESIPVFLLTTGSGGTGINLTAANKVIIFDQSDNPQDDIQAENRAHRLGQTRPVEVIRLVSKDTIEELIYKACQKKLELANKVTGWAQVEMTSGEMEAAVREEMRESMGTPPTDSD